MRITVTMVLDVDSSDALDVVNSALDAGVPQNALGEFIETTIDAKPEFVNSCVEEGDGEV